MLMRVQQTVEAIGTGVPGFLRERPAVLPPRLRRRSP
ncbi:hypothetical protein SAMN05442782_0436 [Streptomyces sp. OK228]|nr:hypothetical protein OK006_9001 [Actinobacteria bacterium OK006]SOE19433.1 hypothetical protein SAMN05442782_0436 [Streptomyces sp. OK228]